MEEIIIKTVAEHYIKLKEQKTEIEAEMKKLEQEYLLPNAETIIVPELEKKVTYIAEKTTTKINSEKLFDQLWSEMRGNEIKAHFSITEKALTDFSDGVDLIEKYKETKGFTKASLRVSALTKKELKELAE